MKNNKKKQQPRLQLKTTTVRVLTPSETAAIAGGALRTCTVTVSCLSKLSF